jgi:hypothetical protein
MLSAERDNTSEIYQHDRKENNRVCSATNLSIPKIVHGLCCLENLNERERKGERALAAARQTRGGGGAAAAWSGRGRRDRGIFISALINE